MLQKASRRSTLCKLSMVLGSLNERYIIAYKDLKGNKKELTDSLCQMKIASLLRYAVLSSTPFVRRKLGIRHKTCFFFDLQDGAEYTFRKEEEHGRGGLIDVLKHRVKR